MCLCVCLQNMSTCVCVRGPTGMKMGGRPLWSSCTDESGGFSARGGERERAVLVVIDGAASCPGRGY